MSKYLVVVESPAKANTLKKYLGKDYEVMASVGHVKDLPKSKLGVEVENRFNPVYEILSGKKKVVNALRKASSKAQMVYLASDPDREGEAIAWHIAEELQRGRPKLQISRVLFNEITKSSVLDGISKSCELDQNKYESQQARRILDRLVGYQVSPLLWDKVGRGLSAGRVQSVALRMICEREAEIEAFKSEEYWSITAALENQEKARFEAKLFKINGKKAKIYDGEHAKGLVDELGKATYQISDIQEKEKKRHASPPFITSKLQQEAARKLNFTPKRTMMIAQQLYEGIELEGGEPVGLITYMRTDSVRVAAQAITEVRGYIKERYGREFLPEKPNFYKAKKQAQEAHEAIRPTSTTYSPEDIGSYLSRDQKRLYQLIWDRFVASQMTSAIFDHTTVDIGAGKHILRATGAVPKFLGFLQVYREGLDEGDIDESEEKLLPKLSVEELLNLIELKPQQHFTQPPPRYTEPTLIKALEENGIGRPSTYAAIIGNIEDRKYVAKEERRKLKPTDLGRLINELLVESFPDIFNVEFTATMEEELDEVEEGTRQWHDVLDEFYKSFSKDLKKAKKEMRDVKRQEVKTEFSCEKCGNTMVVKWGRNGEFLACSGYPECRNTKDFSRAEDGTIQLTKEETPPDEKCPNCGGAMVIKRGRFGKFLACSNYPECKGTKAITTGIACPEEGCKGELVQKTTRRGKRFFGCSSYPKCKYATWDTPVKESCPDCGHAFLVQKYSKSKGNYITCPEKECKYSKLVDQ